MLLTVGGLGRQAYTVSIQQRIEQRTGRSASMGAIYTALERLAKKDFVLSWKGEVTKQRGGKRKRFYEITSSGEAALVEARRARERLWNGFIFNPT